MQTEAVRYLGRQGRNNLLQYVLKRLNSVSKFVIYLPFFIQYQKVMDTGKVQFSRLGWLDLLPAAAVSVKGSNQHFRERGMLTYPQVSICVYWDDSSARDFLSLQHLALLLFWKVFPEIAEHTIPARSSYFDVRNCALLGLSRSFNLMW